MRIRTDSDVEFNMQKFRYIIQFNQASFAINVYRNIYNIYRHTFTHTLVFSFSLRLSKKRCRFCSRLAISIFSKTINRC